MDFTNYVIRIAAMALSKKMSKRNERKPSHYTPTPIEKNVPSTLADIVSLVVCVVCVGVIYIAIFTVFQGANVLLCFALPFVILCFFMVIGNFINSIKKKKSK
ncbi:hypothetical protein IQ227_13710 [Anabaena aphanizomenioides LEGE 00250]|uniref:Uncharacterized protein n=1 Tax=Sphaerospermopsis aphanizomenoides LEGE 00250 TaxID=2777972 RepID=A0ABR9VEY3_9CYAN|nr:hypothetical protein [Sphaerospermopsis aphanizomenoides]MBE9237052.1 hypothetical protein [Sphaerospermopsis aphanizomenoides LEGE 00250]